MGWTKKNLKFCLFTISDRGIDITLFEWAKHAYELPAAWSQCGPRKKIFFRQNRKKLFESMNTRN
jgi:hypothetical protein